MPDRITGGIGRKPFLPGALIGRRCEHALPPDKGQ